jgi:thermitase
VIAVPTDGVVYDPELAHCCAQDPELDQAERIKLERAQAEAQRIGLEVQLMSLEVQRRQALLAAGTLTPFVVPPTENIVA